MLISDEEFTISIVINSMEATLETWSLKIWFDPTIFSVRHCTNTGQTEWDSLQIDISYDNKPGEIHLIGIGYSKENPIGYQILEVIFCFVFF